MRPIRKPNLPALPSFSFQEITQALGNSVDVGRFCSFCEKALIYQSSLFHKQRGVLGPYAKFSGDDWAQLLLICEDCAQAVDRFNARSIYYWPDDLPQEARFPYLYVYTQKVPVRVLNRAEGGPPVTEFTQDRVLVQIATDVTEPTRTAAINTYRLFRLNGKFFNENFEHPAFVLPHREFWRPSDYRVEQRWDVYQRGVEAARSLAHGIKAFGVRGGYTERLLAMIDDSIKAFGFQSTWLSAIGSTLDQIDVTLVPKLLAVWTSEPPTERKRRLAVMSDGLAGAEEKARLKYQKTQDFLVRLLKVES
jgi:hypothetical protein